MNTKIIRVPIEVVELEDNSFHILVSVEVNGVCGDVIVDTGASVSVLDQAMFHEEEESLDMVREIQSGSVNGQIKNVKVIHVGLFKLGDLTLQGMPSAILDLTYVNEMYGKHFNRKVLGLLGCDFFVKYRAVIDYDKNILIFSSPEEILGE